MIPISVPQRELVTNHRKERKVVRATLPNIVCHLLSGTASYPCTFLFCTNLSISSHMPFNVQEFDFSQHTHFISSALTKSGVLMRSASRFFIRPPVLELQMLTLFSSSLAQAKRYSLLHILLAN